MHVRRQLRAWPAVGARCPADVVAGVRQVAGLRAATTHRGCSGPLSLQVFLKPDNHP